MVSVCLMIVGVNRTRKSRKVTKYFLEYFVYITKKGNVFSCFSKSKCLGGEKKDTFFVNMNISGKRVVDDYGRK